MGEGQRQRMTHVFPDIAVALQIDNWIATYGPVGWAFWMSVEHALDFCVGQDGRLRV